MTGMKLQSCFRRKEKLTNHLVINVAAHRGLAGTTRPPARLPTPATTAVPV